MVILFVSLLFFPTTILTQHSDTVVGCGGFIRWKEAHPDSVLDFRKLKISLFSETTSTLKDVTDVLPNGAYSVPLYDEGVYRIRLTTPKGWHIEPSDGYLLDLEKDPGACFKDFDFSIVGFSIFGQVTTSGMKTGPPGLSVRLTDPTSHKPMLHNFTQDQGHFIISPVTPGNYLLTVSNQDRSDKDHTRASINITVQSDSINLPEPIILLGHFLRGRVTDFNQNPLVNAKVFLLCDKDKTLSKSSTTLDKSVYSHIVEALGEMHYKFLTIQESSTDSDGYFTFDRLPGGSYLLVPLYTPKKSGVVFSFTPKFLPVAMEHTDVDLGHDTFTLQSFKLNPGRITWPNGVPISSAKITITTNTSQKSVLTDGDGFYQLNHIIAGDYKFQVEVENAFFETFSINLNHLLESLPNLVPDKVSVCGNLIPADTSSDLKLKVYIVVRSVDNSSEINRVETNLEDGIFKFCAFLNPERYSLHPDVSLFGVNQHSDKILRFTPSEIMVDLTGSPVVNVTFSQFRAKLFGRINCLLPCSYYKTPVYAQLTSLHSNTIQPKLYEFIPSKTDLHVAFFKAEDMLPGDYAIQVVFYSGSSLTTIDGWCWDHHEKTDSGEFQPIESSKRILHIRSDDLHYDNESALDFRQTGFLIPVQFELPNYVTRVPTVLLFASNYFKENNTTVKSSIVWNLTKTCNRICLPSPEKVYKISLSSTCTRLRLLQATEINPSKDCHLTLNSSARIRIGVEELPVVIHLKLDQVAARFFDDLKEVFDSPYSFQIDFPSNTSVTPRSKLVETLWSKSSQNVESVSATGVFWLNIRNTIRVTPKSLNLKQNHMVHLITYPSSQDINLQSDSEQQQKQIDDISCSLTIPIVNPSKSTVNDVHSLCSSLFVGQNVEFSLTIAVNLRGRIDPPTERVNIELFKKLPQMSEKFPTSAEHDHLLLPVNSESELVTNTEKETNSSEPISVTQSDSQDCEVFNIKSIFEVSKMYQILLSKAGYKFDIINKTDVKHQLTGFDWYVKSTRLSLVEVFVYNYPVSEDSRQPLSAVLISIIGEGHRANHLTNEEGVVRFVGLSPGQYYVRPMMKEYSFTVKSPDQSESGQAIPVQVEEGKSAVIILSAVRIAFSASGVVTSLAGIPESGVLVEASWLPGTQNTIHNDLLHLKSNSNLTCQLRYDQINIIPREQSVTDSNGNFRIRGLMPGCVYRISVHINPNILSNLILDQVTRESSKLSSRNDVEHAVPDHVNLQMLTTDTNGLHFYIIRHLCTSLITVNVQTPDIYLPTLRLIVFPVGHPENIVAKHDFGIDSSLFSLSGSKLIPMIGREHVIRLISDLEPKFYINANAQNIIFKPKWNVSEHFNFQFHPKLRTTLSD
ncbi:unnamed protein product [Schistosoma margrebowiei]|uniref:SD-repeat containing protein B domain-containing protein n=1 Tax=Schistosoma margrebowiei TaxID=48269 RepID=A0AA84Z962_9TREM|nr:unnamed protein product [Schistosoma margrebowiei]